MSALESITGNLSKVFEEKISYPGVPPAAMRLLMISRAERLLEATDSKHVFSSVNDESVSIVVLSHLSWDSQHLGRKCGRFDVYTNDRITGSKCLHSVINSAMRFVVENGFQHIYVRVPSSWLALINLLTKVGFQYVDGLLLFATNIEKYKIGCDHKPVRLGDVSDMKSCINLTKNLFRQTRFHSDPSISYVEAELIYEQWVQNSFSTAADSVIIAENNGEVAGFVTCKHQHDTYEVTGKRFGTIVLVAIAEKFRGQGIGRIITSGALDWFAKERVDIVEVGTQISNISASRLYEASGFKLVSTSLTFHWSDRFNFDFE